MHIYSNETTLWKCNGRGRVKGSTWPLPLRNEVSSEHDKQAKINQDVIGAVAKHLRKEIVQTIMKEIEQKWLK